MLKIGKKILEKRKEKQMTQDDVAKFLNVSKASVSKWETGTSLPDIELLPQLATLFNISIDELMNYSPQLSVQEIRTVYRRLSLAFTECTFEEAMSQCQSYAKKYFACFPLLLQIAVLYINHYPIAPTETYKKTLVEEGRSYLKRIQEGSEDVNLIDKAHMTESLLLLMIGESEEVVNRYESALMDFTANKRLILCNAYATLNEIDKAEQCAQLQIYEDLLCQFNSAAILLSLYRQNLEKGERVIERFDALIDIFHMETLHPNSIMGYYLSKAQFWMVHQQPEKTMDALENYIRLCLSLKFPLTLHGDDFFDTLDQIIEGLDLGNLVPRHDKIIKQSMWDAIDKNPYFQSLRDYKRFKSQLERFKTILI